MYSISLISSSNFLPSGEKNINLKNVKTVKEIVESVINDTGYIKELESVENPETKSKIENIQELVSAVEDFERRSPDKSLAGYLSQIALTCSATSQASFISDIVFYI